MNQPPVKLGFFFGAGAEICLGLPNGGEFALSLFNRNTASLKDQFKKALGEIIDNKNTTQSYKDWLAYKNKISSFTENDFKTVITSSAEHKKEAIINFSKKLMMRPRNYIFFLIKSKQIRILVMSFTQNLLLSWGLIRKIPPIKLRLRLMKFLVKLNHLVNSLIQRLLR